MLSNCIEFNVISTVDRELISFLCFFNIFQVYAVASEDMDSLTFGAPVFLRHLMDPSTRKIPVMEFEVSKVVSTYYF